MRVLPYEREGAGAEPMCGMRGMTQINNAGASVVVYWPAWRAVVCNAADGKGMHMVRLPGAQEGCVRGVESNQRMAERRVDVGRDMRCCAPGKRLIRVEQHSPLR